MENDVIKLTPGLYADVDNDWQVHVVEACARNSAVFYVGKFPYDASARPLHPDSPAILNVWDKLTPGARQISERQKRFANVMTVILVEPTHGLLQA